MRPQQEQGQQPPPQQQQQEQGQQQEQLGAATGGEHLEHQRWAPAGGSPKRPHDELADGVLACLAPHSRAGSGEENGGGWEAGEGGGKRHRHVDGGGGELRDGAAGRAPRGASPTAQLRNHLQQALHGNLLHTGGHAFQPQEWQQEAQQQQPDQQPAPQAAAAAAEAAGAGEARLAGQLAAALQQAVAAGLLPPAAYPPPKVQPPTAKQRKLLPAGVACTSAYPLAVAAAASKAAGSRRSPEEVAALLLQQLPAEVAAAAQAAKGHLNFGASVAGPEAAEAEMGDAAAAAAAAAATAPAAAAAAAPAGLAQPTAAYPSTQLASKPLQQQVQAPAAGGAGAAASAAAAAAAAAVASAARAAAAAVPRGVPRHFELRTLPSSEPSLEGVEFQLFKKYQVGPSCLPRWPGSLLHLSVVLLGWAGACLLYSTFGVVVFGLGPCLLRWGICCGGLALDQCACAGAWPVLGSRGGGGGGLAGSGRRGEPRHVRLTTLPHLSVTHAPPPPTPLNTSRQIVHHGDKPSEVTPRSFCRFLIDTPLRHAGPEQYPPGVAAVPPRPLPRRCPPPGHCFPPGAAEATRCDIHHLGAWPCAGGCPSIGFGSFHQQYWLDGKLGAWAAAY